MKKNLPIIVAGLLLLLAISAVIAVKFYPNILAVKPANNVINSTKNTSTGIILFYGNGCPHCAIVEKYLADNKIEDKVAIDKLEVFSNADNAALLGEKAQSCGLNTDNIGVPFVWDGSDGKCYVGDQEVDNFFQQKLNQSNNK
ncbi:MAG: hypothetical protein PHO56_04555 [Patescibacteria group bacterium]|nr:hypothetical protein [Patescibacteria group bacterium]